MTLNLTDCEAAIVRRALGVYAEQGADGCTTECWNIHTRIIDAQVKEREQSYYCTGEDCCGKP